MTRLETARFALVPDEGALAAVSEAEAIDTWIALRWPGGIVCSQCGASDLYDVSRPGGLWRRRCKAGSHDFTLTSGTPFSHLKVSIKTVLLMLSVARHGLGKRSLATFAEHIGIEFKTAYVMFGKAGELLSGKIDGVSGFRGYWQNSRATQHRQWQKEVAKQDEPPSADLIDAADLRRPKITYKELVFRNISSRTDPATVQERDASKLIGRSRFVNDLRLMSRANWSLQDNEDLKTLALAGATIEQAASALGRGENGVAWHARDHIPSADVPHDWKRPLVRPKLVTEPRMLVYPYLPAMPKMAATNGAQLTMDVAAMVARSYPDFMRADICQTVLLAILEGKATLSDLQGSPEELRQFVRQYRRGYDSLPTSNGWRGTHRSIDAPISDDDDRNPLDITMPPGVLSQLEW